MDSTISVLVVIIKQHAGFVSARPRRDCLLEVCKEIVKKKKKTSNELKETRAGIIRKLILSAALAQKGRMPLGLLWTCTSSIPIWFCAGLVKLQHNQQQIGAGSNKTASSSRETLTATVELGSAPESCSNSSTPGSGMPVLSPPCSGTRHWVRGSEGCLLWKARGGPQQWEPWINAEHFLYPKRLHKLQQLFRICLSPFLPPAHPQDRS